ncbi:hypothetical protein [Clostridium thermarum]|nr:hypothetical protein [Clostridium thermarum]
MIKSLNKNISIDETFEERFAIELEERPEMQSWTFSCDCDGFECGTYKKP